MIEEIAEVADITKDLSIKKAVKIANPPSLKELAYETIKREKPSLFFSLQDMEVPAEIKNNPVEAFIADKIKQAEKNYSLKVEERKKTVEAVKKELITDRCFVKSVAFMGGLLVTGLYLGITIPVLKAVDADAEARATCYALTIVSFIVGNCVGMCFAGKTAKALAECTTPKVAQEVAVDLEEIATEYQSMRR
ncbi:hypothetical protein [Legionella clemsonensis]|uniref:Uncharacterized protein n=1 Tax=Legionella clemsonensis TaxID=1867846 RepID=A0A222P4E9_9GAMM|nr:hypothetical protein [Legionella clemsonensis]ASQ46716.1 hypothetical protein clem_10850 [Legionella clemsonensis]